MNRYKAMYAALMVGPVLAFVSTQARAEFKCDTPQPRIDRVACEKAAEGPASLRRYVERMRVIDTLYFPDYVNEARAREWAGSRPERPSRSSVQIADQAENPGA
jgi:hypothetical protein